jgi:DNA-binding beta-propeller fold protein YncE
MKYSSNTLLAAFIVTTGLHTPAEAQTFKQVATIQIPGKPIDNYGVLAIDQGTGLGYLADKDNAGVVVFDTKTDTFVTRIEGFVGAAGRTGTTSGPNGLVVVNGGAQLWVSDGDSTIKVVDLKTHKVVDTFATGGKRRANGMAFDPDSRSVIVANSNDAPTFLSVISTEPGHKIVAKHPLPQSAENLERSAYHAPSRTFFTAIPVLVSDPAKGILAQTDPKNGTVKLHELERCHPHSLSIVSDSTIFLGCSAAHGPNKKPGGDMAIFDIASGKMEDYRPGLGGNGGSTVDRKRGLYYHAATNGVLVVVDTKTRALVQKVPTWNGSRSPALNLATGRIYVATAAKTGPCGGCIAAFARE